MVVDIPTAELDHVLNGNNIFIDRVLPFVKMEGKKIRVDFSPAGENKVRLHISAEQKPLVNTFLVRAFATPPKVRSIIFASTRGR